MNDLPLNERYEAAMAEPDLTQALAILLGVVAPGEDYRGGEGELLQDVCELLEVTPEERLSNAELFMQRLQGEQEWSKQYRMERNDANMAVAFYEGVILDLWEEYQTGKGNLGEHLRLLAEDISERTGETISTHDQEE